MTEESAYSILDLVNQDKRYPVEAYNFVRDALAFASDSMELGAYPEDECDLSPEELQQARRERHLSGQQLCEAIRQYALNQFGYMAKLVLKYWKIESTQCFGNIVYNLISVGIMKTSSNDRREHFDDVYDFNEAFEDNFEICCGSIAQRRS